MQFLDKLFLAFGKFRYYLLNLQFFIMAIGDNAAAKATRIKKPLNQINSSTPTPTPAPSSSTTTSTSASNTETSSNN